MITKNIFDNNRNFHGAKGIVFINKKMLVYRRDNKTDSFPLYIDLPGGGRENNESPYETFKREVKEEFGFKITKKDILYAKQYVSAMDASKESYFIVVRLNVTEKDIVFGDEGLDFFLIETENYLKLNDAIRRQQNRVLDYINSKK